MWLFLSRFKTSLIILCAVLLVLSGFYVLHQRNQTVGVLRVDAGPRSGDTYFLMSQLSEVVERNSTTIRLNVLESDGRSERTAERLRNSVDLSTIQSHTPTLPNTMLVSDLYEEIFQLFTTAESGIETITDLAGKRIALPPHGSPELRFFWAIGDHYDLFVQDVTWVSMPETLGIQALLNGSVDAFFTVGTARNLATLKLIEEFDLSPRASPLKMIAIDQAPAMAIKRPYVESVHIEKGTFDGSPPLPDERLPSAAVRRLLVASDKADPNHISELTRVLFENRSDLAVRFPLANRIEAPDLNSGLRLPLHPGALRYYTRDEPSFIQENAEPLALLVTVTTMLASALFALRSSFMARQKNRADHFNHSVISIGEKVRGESDRTALLEQKTALEALLKQAVEALDTDKVTDEGFQSFAFLWQTVSAELENKLSQEPVVAARKPGVLSKT